MSEPFIGEIRIVGFNFAPQGWAECNGQLLSIQQNTALFSLLGTTYGGNGQTNFALPDLRGRVAVSQGQGPGLSLYGLGETGGSEGLTLTTGQMPAHSHGFAGSPNTASTSDPTAGVYSKPNVNPRLQPLYGPNLPANAAAGMLDPAGGSSAHENRQPILTVEFIIALQGIFPPHP